MHWPSATTPMRRVVTRSASCSSRRRTSCCLIRSAVESGTPATLQARSAPASPPRPDHGRPTGAGRGPAARRRRRQIPGAPAGERRPQTSSRHLWAEILRCTATRGRPARSHGGKKAAHARIDANPGGGEHARRRPRRVSRAHVLRGPEVRRRADAPRRPARPGRPAISRRFTWPRTSRSITGRAARPGRWPRGPTSGAATRICPAVARSATRAPSR